MSNVLAELLAEVTGAEDALKKAETEAAATRDEIAWFESFDEGHVRTHIDGLVGDISVLAGTIAGLATEEAHEQNRYRELRSEAGSVLNPLNWFNKDKKESRAVARDQREQRDEIRTKLRDQRQLESRLVAEKKDCDDSLARFKAFDLRKHTKLLGDQEKTETAARDQAVGLRALYDTVKTMAAEALREFDTLSEKLRPLNERLDRATVAVANLRTQNDETLRNTLEDRLKDQFGTVDLKAVINGCQAEMKSIDGQLAGIEDKIRETIAIARRKMRIPTPQEAAPKKA
ncbi:hypothetical protein BVG79_00734 [Ketogulonicigenium robustum]|uniref:Uncharacterized protein n=1 Tax=Ketogulonicigenium robustum TaxID=92947 RepID=A0A1W6NXW0_9RHOB|nr:hypothetical protein [Ketogulonicigenium robustum]ARO14086.1 hypothetical protein BVG79_00734 [Ketogulonicigenium robustum]